MFSHGAGRAFTGARLRRSLLVGVGAAAISLTLAPGALANTVIDTTPAWQASGSQVLSNFGVNDANFCCTQTWGQTVTVPATDTALDSFTFYVDLPTSLIFRGEVYAWDPTTGNPANNTAGNATGPALYESGQTRTTSYNSGFSPQPITFNTGGIPLTAGKQYVLFISVSRDYAANAPGPAGFAGYVPTGTPGEYPGGDFVFLNNGGDVSQWTTVPWSQFKAFGQDDLAFKASFSPPLPTSKAQCLNGGWKTYGVFKNQGACVSFVASGGKNPPSGP
jgi:hypothetical protein